MLLFIHLHFSDFFNMVMRTSRSYAETATGLLIAGCGSSAVDITELNANAAVTSESDSEYRQRLIVISSRESR